MKFSIRDMFLATFVVALGLLAWLSAAAINQQKRKLSEAENQLASEELEAMRLAGEQQYHQASIDRFLIVDGIGKQAELAVQKLQERYGEITPANEQTVSIRTVPMLIDRKAGVKLNRTRVYVPEQREVYLILRTVRAKGFHGSNGQLNEPQPNEPPPQIDTRLVANGGPFQTRLTPGLHDIDWVTSAQQVGKDMTLNVYLDHQLQSTSSWSSDSHGSPRMHKSFLDQTDIAFTQLLPELVNVLVATESTAEPFAPDAFQFYLQLLLGDKQGDYLSFPPTEKRDDKP